MHRPVLIGLCLLLPTAACRADAGKVVDELVAKMLRNQFKAPQQQRLRDQGEPAVARVLHHLRTGDRNHQLVALAMLQHVWTANARAPVARYLKDPDDQFVYYAMLCLLRHVPRDDQAAVLRPLITHRNADFASQALGALERGGGDVGRMLRFLRDHRRRKAGARYLTRYHSPRLTPVTLKMLNHADAACRRDAITALIQQNAAASGVRRRVGAMFKDDDVGVRDRAAEYFMWHGRGSDRRALARVLPSAEDPWERAAIAAAIAAIEARKPLWTANDKQPLPDLPATDLGDNAHARALRALQVNPTDAGARAAFRTYRAAEAFEPWWQYTGEQPTATFMQRCTARRLLQARLFAFPQARTTRPPAAGDTVEIPAAKRVLPPIRDYFDPDRKSFGHFVDDNGGPFANTHHVADDCGWHMPHETVVAIAPGLVRAAWCGRSWGGIVVVEHRIGGAAFCSLYSHLSPFMTVQAGDVVQVAQKLGSIGRRFTWENGGYDTHLHFGIRRVPFGDGTWITGYLPPARFNGGDHGWVDPQRFFTRHGARQTP